MDASAPRACTTDGAIPFKPQDNVKGAVVLLLKQSFRAETPLIPVSVLPCSQYSNISNKTSLSSIEEKDEILSLSLSSFEQNEEQNFEKEITDAKDRKRIQLAEAEKEHDVAVAEEEKEDAENKEKIEAD